MAKPTSVLPVAGFIRGENPDPLLAALSAPESNVHKFLDGLRAQLNE